MFCYEVNISYYIINNKIADDDLYKITDLYDQCTWHSSNIEFDRGLYSKRSNLFRITSNYQFKYMIEDIKKSGKFIIDYVSCDGECIYQLIYHTKAIKDNLKQTYLDKINKLYGHKKEIHNLLIK